MRQSDWTHQISLSFQVRLQFHISISENGVELFRTQTVIHIYDFYTIRLQGNENEVEAEGESTFDPVEKMQQFGINASDIQKLKDGGYYTIGMVLKTPQKVIPVGVLGL